MALYALSIQPESFMMVLSWVMIGHAISMCVWRKLHSWPHNDLQTRGFVIQHRNELRDLKINLLSMVCSDVEVKPVLQDIMEEQLIRGSNRAQDARLDIWAAGFWDPQSLAFFDVRVSHPNAESYRGQEHKLYSRSIASMKMSRSCCAFIGECWMLSMACIYYYWRDGEGMHKIP